MSLTLFSTAQVYIVGVGIPTRANGFCPDRIAINKTNLATPINCAM